MTKIKLTREYEIETDGNLCKNYCKHFKGKVLYCSLFDKHLQLEQYPDLAVRCKDCLEVSNGL